jgi:hypothetical protein
MSNKCLSKCHDKLAAKHIVLFCLASNKNSITMPGIKRASFNDDRLMDKVADSSGGGNQVLVNA